MITIRPSAFRNWQRPFVLKVVRFGRLFSERNNADLCIVHCDSRAGFEMILKLGTRKIHCHYNDYSQRQNGWVVNKNQVAVQEGTLGKKLLMERLSAKHSIIE